MRFVVASIVATIVIIAGLIGWYESSTPTSTSGVTEIGDNQVRLPAGEQLILTHTVGKVTRAWEITYDGNQTVTIYNNAGWPFGEDVYTGTLCGVGCSADVDMGWGSHIYVSLLPDGAASVNWPDGWYWRR